MSRDASGNFTLAPGNPVISGTIIQTQWANPTLSDIAAALTDSLSRSGKGGMAAPLDMGGYRITALGAAMQATDAPQATQVRDQSFTWLNPVASSAAGNDYIGTVLLGTLPVNGTAYQFLADKNNTGAMTLAVNGGASLPILIHGVPTPPGLVLAGAVVEVVYVALTYRMVSVFAASGTVNSVQSTDPALISVVNDAGTNIATLTPHSNVTGGMVKLDSGNKVPPILLPFTDLHYVGIWNATPGTNPSTTGLGNGDFYIITVAGTLTLFRDSGANTYTAQATAVVVGDAIILRAGSTNPSQPDGWYFDPGVAKPAVASTVSMTATSANAPFAGITNLQTWLNAADPAILARLPLAGGTMSGPIFSAAVPSGAAELANKLYVDTKTASGVLSFNARTGAVTLTSSDVAGALGFTPFNAAGGVLGGNLAVTGSGTFTQGIAANFFQPHYYTATVGATTVIDAANGQSQNLTLTANLVITAINNIPLGSILRVIFSPTTFTVTFPGSVFWPLGVAPSLAAGPLKAALVVFENAGGMIATATVY